MWCATVYEFEEPAETSFYFATEEEAKAFTDYVNTNTTPGQLLYLTAGISDKVQFYKVEPTTVEQAIEDMRPYIEDEEGESDEG